MEHLKGKSALVLGAYVSAAAGMRVTSFSNTIDGNREALAQAWEAFEQTDGCLKIATLMVDAAQPNRARMLHLVERNFSTATDLADAMVRQAGLSFRDAHHVAGGVVRMAMDQGLGANQITTSMVDDAAKEVVGRPLGLSAELVAQCLDPAKAVAARRTTGSPEPGEVRRRAAALGKVLAAARERQAQRRARLETAEKRLQAATREVLS